MTIEKLNNKIDYILATGNHDYGKNGSANNRQIFFNHLIQYRYNTAYIGSKDPDDYTNSYLHLNIQGQPYQSFSLDAPRESVVRWADSLSKQHPERKEILLTHAYLGEYNNPYDYRKYATDQSNNPHIWAKNFSEFGRVKIHDGQQLWENLVMNNNFGFDLGGHRTAVGRLVSPIKEKIMS